MKPKTEEEIIEAEVVEQARTLWGRPYDEYGRPYNKGEGPCHDLPYTYCILCGDGIKRPCVCSVVDGSALCVRHWISRRIKERLAEAREKKKAVVAKIELDVDDFART